MVDEHPARSDQDRDVPEVGAPLDELGALTGAVDRGQGSAMALHRMRDAADRQRVVDPPLHLRRPPGSPVRRCGGLPGAQPSPVDAVSGERVQQPSLVVGHDSGGTAAQPKVALNAPHHREHGKPDRGDVGGYGPVPAPPNGRRWSHRPHRRRSRRRLRPDPPSPIPPASSRTAPSTASGVGMTTIDPNAHVAAQTLAVDDVVDERVVDDARAGSILSRSISGSTLSTIWTVRPSTEPTRRLRGDLELQATTTCVARSAAASASAFSSTSSACPPSVPPQKSTISGRGSCERELGPLAEAPASTELDPRARVQRRLPRRCRGEVGDEADRRHPQAAAGAGGGQLGDRASARLRQGLERAVERRRDNPPSRRSRCVVGASARASSLPLSGSTRRDLRVGAAEVGERDDAHGSGGYAATPVARSARRSGRSIVAGV